MMRRFDDGICAHPFRSGLRFMWPLAIGWLAIGASGCTRFESENTVIIHKWYWPPDAGGGDAGATEARSDSGAGSSDGGSMEETLATVTDAASDSGSTASDAVRDAAGIGARDAAALVMEAGAAEADEPDAAAADAGDAAGL